MMIFWHIIASFFLGLGLLDFIFEIKKALFRENTDGLWLLVSLDSENEARAERLLRKASDLSENVPVMVCLRDVSEETEEICRRICEEEGFERIDKDEL